MQSNTRSLSARDRQTINRIVRPAEHAATLVRQYLESDEYRALVSKLVREELVRLLHKELDHVE